MPRDGSGTYSLPAGSTVTNGDTSDASDINTPLADLETDMNTVRPIVAGGTGQNSLANAQTAFKIAPYDGAANISGTWEWQDSVPAVFGNDADSSIRWDGSQLLVKTAAFKIQNAAGTEDLIEAVEDSFVKLRYNNTARLTTTSTGIDVTGEVETDTFGTTAVAQIDLRAKLTLATKQASTSGTAIDFTGIPAGVKEINIMFNGVSLSGSDNFLVQIGDSGGVEATGYESASTFSTTAPATTVVGSAVGFIVARSSGATIAHGMMTLRLLDAATNTWAATHTFSSNGGVVYHGSGTKALSAELDRVRITRDGTNTFDAGEINISYR